MSILPTGRSMTTTFTTIYRVADGKIAEEWGNADILGMLQQLGGMPAPEGRPSGLRE